MEIDQRPITASDISIPIIAGLVLRGITALSAVGGIVGYAAGFGTLNGAKAAAAIAAGWIFGQVVVAFPQWMKSRTPDAPRRIERVARAERVVGQQRAAGAMEDVQARIEAVRRRVLPQASPAA